MKNVFARLIALFAMFLCFPLTALAEENYTLDPTHSYVEWHISHFGFSNPSGKWLVQGTLTLDEKNPQQSKINVTINIGDLVTGIPKLDEHLKTADFFDASKYPTATFVSQKVMKTGKDTAKVMGILTLHGVSKPLTLDVTLNKIAESPITHKKTAGFTASATIKRSEFGIDKYVPNISDEVKIHIEAEAYLT
jgi:polyisoprenoid-binding protein YceI